MMAPSQTLVDLLHERAQAQPDRLALTFLQDGEEQASHLTYGELDQQVRAIAAYLQRVVTPGERALLLFPPGLTYVTAFLACLYSGVVAVPAYPPRPNRSLARLEAILRDAQPAVILTAQSAAAVWQCLEPAMLSALQIVEVDSIAPTLAEVWQAPCLHGETLAFLQYTSGSTGVPKGVMIAHDNLRHNLEVIRRCFGHTEDSQGVIWLPPYHDMGLIGGILQPLYGNFPVVLMSHLTCLQKPARWLQAISRYRATTSGGPNFAYDLCVERIPEPMRAQLDLRSWQVAFTGAEPVRAATLERFSEAFTRCGFRPTAFYPCYGLAEATLCVTGGEKHAPPTIRRLHTADLEQHQATPFVDHTTASSRLVSCGRPWLGNDLCIVNSDTLTPCPDGQVGEIWVAGPSVAQGYWNRPTETALTFGARLAGIDAGPFLRTGDLGVILDGELFVTGRIKELIILDGRNLYPYDIESTVSQCHPALSDASGAAFAIDVRGTEQLVITQEIARAWRHTELQPIVQAIRRAVATDHDIAVHGIMLLKPGRLPKTSSGKLQRTQCRTWYVQGVLEAELSWHVDRGFQEHTG